MIFIFKRNRNSDNYKLRIMRRASLNKMTEDIHTIYASLDSVEQGYIELSEAERYQKIRNKWLILTESTVLNNEDISYKQASE